MRKRAKFMITFILICFVSTTSVNNYNNIEAGNTFAFLVLKTNGGGVRPNLGLYVAQYCREIGINIQVKTVEWAMFVGELLATHNYDLAIVSWSGMMNPDMSSCFMEYGSRNLFAIRSDIPYIYESDQMLKEGVMIIDESLRQQHYFDWQQLLMDKIIPILPLYTNRRFYAVWSNIKGYDNQYGLSACLPYMSYDGYHYGQKDLSEFNIPVGFWLELNPALQVESESGFVTSLTNDVLINWDPERQVNYGLIEDWDMINETHYKFHLRDNLFWNPSYNVTERDLNSPPLSSIPSSELMKGLKNGEYSNGTNQQITAKDAVFTYLVYANNEVSKQHSFFTWLKDVYVDPLDELAFHLRIDANVTSRSDQIYADFWYSLPVNILPEFFLNSSDPTTTTVNNVINCTGIYPDITKTPQWTSYSISAFGCGMFMLDYYVLNTLTVLKRSPFWHGIGFIDGQTGKEPFVETFNLKVIGDYTSSILEFKAGNLEYVGVSMDHDERKKMESDSRFVVYSYLRDGYSFLIFNMMRPFIGGFDNYVWLDEPGKENYTKACAVRKGICYAIDRDEMNRVFFDDQCITWHTPIVPTVTYYVNEEIIKYYHDYEMALEWLRAAKLTIITDENLHPLFFILSLVGAASSSLFFSKYTKRKK
jgi:ABC-type transport system substrate-binding protein